jgi:hypothetical protein
MSSFTYQTKCPEFLTTFCEAMGLVFGKVERDLYKAVQHFYGYSLNS